MPETASEPASPRLAGASHETAEEKTMVQTYENHRRFPPVYGVVAAIIGINILIQAWSFIQRPHFDSAWNLAVSMTLMAILYFSRRNATIVQDRVIRLEMRLRLERLLPPECRGDIEKLSVEQLIALRFSDDAQLPGLVDEILAQNITNQNAIKKKVKNWRADWLRV